MTNLLEMRNQDRRRKRRCQDHSRRAWYREQRSRQLLPSQNLAKGPRAAGSDHRRLAKGRSAVPRLKLTKGLASEPPIRSASPSY